MMLKWLSPVLLMDLQIKKLGFVEQQISSSPWQASLVSLQTLDLGDNRYKFVDTTQLVVLSSLFVVHLDWIHPTEDFAPFLSMPNLRFINFRANGMLTFSSNILKNLSGLRSILFGKNKLSSLPDLGGVEGQVKKAAVEGKQIDVYARSQEIYQSRLPGFVPQLHHPGTRTVVVPYSEGWREPGGKPCYLCEWTVLVSYGLLAV